ncbi:hypothetical protein SAY87_019876 [Trapa incisa]|uniref:Uncharacterized protein n=1 Tax=Trapa incisa TaxID=236973 RepID=A0AAN7K8K7_9MYRT|nr:hypothetical protein SAY87_019876 [Trapa incisa]
MGITYYGPHHPFQERKQDHTKGIVFQTLGPGKLKFNFQCYKPHHNYINYGHLTYLGQTQYVHRGYSGYPKGKIEIDRSIDRSDREVCGVGWISKGGVGEVQGEGPVVGLLFIIVVVVCGGEVDTREALERGEEGRRHSGADP